MAETGTKTERAFAAKMKGEGWQVFKNGFPDFLCVKDGESILVEVKAYRSDALKKHQLEMMTLLNNRQCKAFIWTPDEQDLIPLDIFRTRFKVKPIPLSKARQLIDRNQKLYDFWLAHKDTMTLTELGRMFGPMSRERARQIIAQFEQQKAS